MTIRLRTLGIVLALVLAAAGGGAALLLYGGFYDVSATQQHTRGVFALMDYAMRRSVKARSGGLAVPDLQEPQRIRRGGSLYRAHCVQCHGAPGVAPEPFAFGLTPAPANLVGTARTWADADMFWVIRNGIKMTGMPAWVYRLRDDEIWDVVAFVRASVSMTPQQYAGFAAALPARRDQVVHGDVPAGPAEPLLGDVDAGRRAAQAYLCVTCHTIPGIVGADRHVGPPLNGVARRGYIAGVVPNTPQNMVGFLQDPGHFDPLTAMPKLGLSARDARDIAAFLYTLDELPAE